MDNYIKKENLEGLLRHSFEDLDSELISKILDKGKIVAFESRDEIISQGDFSTDVYLLIMGKLKVKVRDEFQKETIINEISVGEFFGETPVFLMATSPGGRGGAGVLEAAQGRIPRDGSELVGVFSLPSFGANFLEGKIANEEKDTELKQLVQKIKG
mgnify:CR=1 FL=1